MSTRSFFGTADILLPQQHASISPPASSSAPKAAAPAAKSAAQAPPDAPANDSVSVSNGQTPLTKDGYPPIYGATQEQANQIWSDMSSMPEQDRQTVNAIYVGKSYTTGTFQVNKDNSSGQEQGYGDIFINDSDLQNPSREQYVVLCESGHSVEIHDGVLSGSTQNDWGTDVDGNTPQDYSDPINPDSEHFADAYAAYYGGDASQLEKAAPQEYEDLSTGAYENSSYGVSASGQIIGGLNAGVVSTMAATDGEKGAKQLDSSLAYEDWGIGTILGGEVDPEGPPVGIKG